MPSLLPEEYFVQSKRRDAFGDDMFSLKDRTDRSYVLGPTHEELFADVCRDMIHSYKDRIIYILCVFLVQLLAHSY
jgi:prolyl-tRNA synthetase